MNLFLHISSDDDQPLVTLQWLDGYVAIVSATDRMRVAAHRWITRGLSEWIRTDFSAEPRFTESSVPDFFPRLARHLESQFKFRTRFEYEGTGAHPLSTPVSMAPVETRIVNDYVFRPQTEAREVIGSSRDARAPPSMGDPVSTSPAASVRIEPTP